jgi:nicotinamidase-related amidase
VIYILWAIGLLVVALLLYTLLGIYRLLTPTRGRPIDRIARPGEALLVIDMQQDFTRKTGPQGYDPARVEAAIASVNGLAREAHEKGVPVVSIRQILSAPLAAAIARILAGPEGITGSPGIGLDPRLDLKTERDFTKERGDAFSNSELERWLDENRIGRLRLAGLDGCHCIQRTARGALNRGYAVEIAESGVLTADAAGWATWRTKLRGLGAALPPEKDERAKDPGLPAAG